MGSLSTAHTMPGPSGTEVPTGAIWVSSPGTIPRLHTVFARACPFTPAPWTTTQTATLTPMRK